MGTRDVTFGVPLCEHLVACLLTMVGSRILRGDENGQYFILPGYLALKNDGSRMMRAPLDRSYPGGAGWAFIFVAVGRRNSVAK